MIFFKKWAKHKVESYIYCVNQFSREEVIKTETKDVNKTVSFVQFL